MNSEIILDGALALINNVSPLLAIELFIVEIIFAYLYTVLLLCCVPPDDCRKEEKPGWPSWKRWLTLQMTPPPLTRYYVKE